MEIESTTTSGARYRTVFAAKGRSRLFRHRDHAAQAGLALALDDLPDRAGRLTPA
ncbi:MAG: hypothetical protein IPH03_17030 [Tetrasphaera sp.]|nr:hypothetical protein [Tetrasphaera sp.]